MLAAILALTLSPQETVTLSLAADAYLDRKSPGANTGREPLLVGGVDKAVLIRFPELGLSVGAGKRVRSAHLTFTAARPGEPKVGSVGRVLKPWGEGGWRLDQFGGDSPPTMVAAATWNDSLAGKDGLAWERGGAAGRNDATPLTVGRTELKDEEFTLFGLEGAVQAMIDDPQHNYGLRIEFSNATTLFSADSLGYGPKLVLELEAKAEQPAPDLRVVSCEMRRAAPPAEGQPMTWSVAVRNVGDVDSRAQSLVVTYYGKEAVERKINEAIAVGETKTLTFTLPHRAATVQPAMQPVVVRVLPEEGDRNASDNGLTVYQGSLKVAVAGVEWDEALAVVTDLNERVFPFSKFGAWPMGCTERLQLVMNAEGADVVARVVGGDVRRAVLRAVTGLPDALLRPFASLAPQVNGSQATGFITDAGQAGLFPDTRDDVIVPQALAIPDRTSTALIFGDLAMNDHKMLSRSETTIINTLAGKRGAERALPWNLTPSSIFFRVFTPDGVTTSGAKLDVYQLVGGAFGSQPVFSAQLGQDGSALMTPRPSGAFAKPNPYGDLQPDGSNGWLLAVVTANQTTHSSWIPVWQLWDEAVRGNTAAAFIELRVQLASGVLVRGENLALNRLVTDLKGRFPAELNALVDGKEETSVAFGQEPEGYWIEIDLGRDLQIGEVSLVFDGPVWKQFRILTYKTAQSPDEGQVWSEEANGPANPGLKTSPDGMTTLSYLAKSVRSRFIRIAPFSGESVKLSEIKIVPIGTG